MHEVAKTLTFSYASKNVTAQKYLAAAAAAVELQGIASVSLHAVPLYVSNKTDKDL